MAVFEQGRRTYEADGGGIGRDLECGRLGHREQDRNQRRAVDHHQ